VVTVGCRCCNIPGGIRLKDLQISLVEQVGMGVNLRHAKSIDCFNPAFQQHIVSCHDRYQPCNLTADDQRAAAM